MKNYNKSKIGQVLLCRPIKIVWSIHPSIPSMACLYADQYVYTIYNIIHVYTHTSIINVCARVFIFTVYICIDISILLRVRISIRVWFIMQWTSPDDFKSKLHNFKRFFRQRHRQHWFARSLKSLNMKFLFQQPHWKLTLCKYSLWAIFCDIFLISLLFVN